MEYEGEKRTIIQRRRWAQGQRGTIRYVCRRDEMSLIIWGMMSQLRKAEKLKSERGLDYSLWLSTWIIRLFSGRKQWTIHYVWAQNNFYDPWTLTHITPIVRQLHWLLINFRTQCKMNFLIIKLSTGLLRSLSTSSAHLALAFSFSLQTTLLVWLKALVSTVPPHHLLSCFASGCMNTDY